MTRVLVSVRSGAEALTALACGVDLIDVKEPSHGALGAADANVWREVVASVSSRVPVSVALGELPEWTSRARWMPDDAVPHGVRFAKVGLAGVAALPDWSERWRMCLDEIRAGIGRVAVIYADWQRVDAPAPEAVLAAALDVGCRALLVDTYDKHGGDLFASLSGDKLRAIIDRAKGEGVLTVVGGSLTWGSLPQALALAPDYVAVRGLVCTGGRDGALDPHRCQRLVWSARQGMETRRSQHMNNGIDFV